MASSSSANQSQLPGQEGLPAFYYYPPALAKYQDVVACPQLFMDTLGKLHAAMGTKFMIPITGGKDLDLHRLFVEVTSRGGIKRVLGEKKWKEVTTAFSFPPSATNASFILRKYYMSLLHHYEQVYYFEANAWTPVSADAWQNMHSAPTLTHAVDEPVQPSTEAQVAAVKQQRLPSSEIVTPAKRQRISATESLPGVTPEPSVGCSVTGMIDGKFESGYLVTVTIGSEQLRGVIYQTPQDAACQMAQHQGLPPQYESANKNSSDNTTPSASGVTRRRRRKKSEMKKRDPAHPKPNRSGYNFFFAEQHARLKPLHPGKDRDISRMIGESWNNLNESERAVYQEKALRDKERYRIEMLQYKESLRVGQTTVPVQQPQPLNLDVNMVVVDENLDAEGGGSPQTLENELTCGKSNRSNSKDDETADNGTPTTIAAGAGIVGTDTETVNNQGGVFEMEKGLFTKIGEGGEECSRSDTEMEAKEELLLSLEQEEEEEEEEEEVEEKEEESVNVQEEKSARAGEEERVEEEAIVPIQDKKAGVGGEECWSFEKESSSPIREKESVVYIQQGIEEKELTAAIQEKESATPEDGEEKESVALPVEERTEIESAFTTQEKNSVNPEDRMKKESNPNEEKEPLGPEESVENLKCMLPVQEESVLANIERVEHEAGPAEERDSPPFDCDKKKLVVSSEVKESLPSEFI